MINNKPCIYIYSRLGNKNIIKEIEAGMEEEGIPYQLIEMIEEIEESFNYLHELCKQSGEHGIFSCGIGVIGDMIAFGMITNGRVHIMEEYRTPSYVEARRLGCNAGRCVKHLPFKLSEM